MPAQKSLETYWIHHVGCNLESEYSLLTIQKELDNSPNLEKFF